MANNFLDKAGLSYFWGKVKSYVTSQLGTKQDKLPTGSAGQMLYQGESGPEWGDKPVMYVNITGSEGNYQADKTLAKIQEAYQNGYAVLAKLGPYIIPLYTLSENANASFILYAGSSGFLAQIFPNNTVYAGTFNTGASDIAFTPGTTGLSAENVQDAIEEVNAKATPKAVSVTLSASGWSGNSQTVTVQGVVADETKQLIQPMPAIASQAAYMAAGIYCSGQAANSLTFTCQTAPAENITVYVVMQEVSV